MKRLNYWLSVLALLGLLLPTACQKDEIDPISIPAEPAMHGVNSIKLGKKLENPYSVSNMKKAWKSLKSVSSSNSRVSGNESGITASHLYVKFKPKDERELSLLKRDTTLILYTYPLDYEIALTGDYYHDPAVPAGQPTYQYASVKVDYKFPNVPYEILEELYIPEEVELAENARTDKAYVADALVEEALRVTGNLNENKETSNNLDEDKETFSSKAIMSWRPAGRIRVWDNTLGPFGAGAFTPVEGVEVRANRWFTTHTGITDANGFYTCDGTFSRPANYSIQWDRYQFSIRSGTYGQAVYDGPKQEGGWNLDIGPNTTQEFFARIFRAAYHYYYKDIKGLRRPPENGTLNTQMKIAAYYEQNTEINGSHKEERRFLGLGNQLKLYNPQNDCDEIYATTIHELAHSSHWDMERSDFDDSNTIVKESWANGVERELTRMVYPSYSQIYSRLDYTGVVHDMVDGVKSVISYYYSKYEVYSSKSYNDNVSGYTIRQLEDALEGQRSWNGWRDNIKNKYSNGTESNLDATFMYWNSK